MDRALVAVQGGLYAELVQNRSFEFTSLAAGNEKHAWKNVGEVTANVVKDDAAGCLNANNPNYMVLARRPASEPAKASGAASGRKQLRSALFRSVLQKGRLAPLKDRQLRKVSPVFPILLRERSEKRLRIRSARDSRSRKVPCCRLPQRMREGLRRQARPAAGNGRLCGDCVLPGQRFHFFS